MVFIKTAGTEAAEGCSLDPPAGRDLVGNGAVKAATWHRPFPQGPPQRPPRWRFRSGLPWKRFCANRLNWLDSLETVHPGLIGRVAWMVDRSLAFHPGCD